MNQINKILPTKSEVDALFSDEIIEKTAEKIIKSGDLGLTLQEKFEAFCEYYNLEYDFEHIGPGVYRSWQTNQAFVIYKFSDMER